MKSRIRRLTLVLVLLIPLSATAQEFTGATIQELVEYIYRTKGLQNDSESLIESMKQVLTKQQSLAPLTDEADKGYSLYMDGDKDWIVHSYSACLAAMQQGMETELATYYTLDEKLYARNPFVLIGDNLMEDGRYSDAEAIYRLAFPIDVYSPQYLYSYSPESVFNEVWCAFGSPIYKQLYSYPLQMLRLSRAAKASGSSTWESYLNEAFYYAVDRLYRAFLALDEKRQMWLTNLYSPVFEMQYGNPDTGWAYDAALFIKGCENNVSADIRDMYTDEVNIDAWGGYIRRYNRNAEYVETMKKTIRKWHPSERYEEFLKARSDCWKNPTKKNAATLDSLSRVIQEDMSWYKPCLRSLRTSYEDVRDALAPSTAAVEFVKVPGTGDGQAHYDALVLRTGSGKPERVALCSERELKDALSGDRYAPYEIGDHRLYDLLWKPIEGCLADVGKVLYSPDGLLNMVNLNMLSDASGKRVCEKFTAIRTSSTREACRGGRTVKQEASLYGGLKYDMTGREMAAANEGFGGYVKATRGLPETQRSGISELSYSLEEVQEIGNVLYQDGFRCSLYTGKEGTEESFKAMSGHSPSVLHLATHGFFLNETKAMGQDYYSRLCLSDSTMLGSAMTRSGLLLSGAQNAWTGADIPERVEDGVLLAQEIASLDLGGTSLLVLSACQTALGDITAQGVTGLQQGFKKAGVKMMVLTLWEVNDEATKEFMTAFYRGVIEGMTVNEAFRKTQLSMSRDPRFSHPYYWAGFILVY